MQQGIILNLLPLLIPSLPYFFARACNIAKVAQGIKKNIACSHCNMITQLGEALGGGHCGHTTIFLKEASNESAKNLNFLFSF